MMDLVWLSGIIAPLVWLPPLSGRLWLSRKG